MWRWTSKNAINCYHGFPCCRIIWTFQVHQVHPSRFLSSYPNNPRRCRSLQGSTTRFLREISLPQKTFRFSPQVDETLNILEIELGLDKKGCRGEHDKQIYQTCLEQPPRLSNLLVQPGNQKAFLSFAADLDLLYPILKQKAQTKWNSTQNNYRLNKYIYIYCMYTPVSGAPNLFWWRSMGKVSEGTQFPTTNNHLIDERNSGQGHILFGSWPQPNICPCMVYSPIFKT